MSKRGGSFGIVVLVIVVAVVLYLTARAWSSVAPEAGQITNPGVPRTVDDPGRAEALEAVRETGLPDLDETRVETAAHAAELEEALAAAE
jgi:hypothetical protein